MRYDGVSREFVGNSSVQIKESVSTRVINYGYVTDRNLDFRAVAQPIESTPMDLAMGNAVERSRMCYQSLFETRSNGN
jgi:hypothetical protein